MRLVINRRRLDAGEPAIAVLTDSGVEYADEVRIGAVTVTGVAMGHDPVSGARVWIETDQDFECVTVAQSAQGNQQGQQ